MIYFTISKTDCGIVIDSISNDYQVLKQKFPQDKIYQSDEPIISIYILKEKLHEVGS